MHRFDKLFLQTVENIRREGFQTFQFLFWEAWKKGVDEIFETLSDELKNSQVDLEWYYGRLSDDPLYQTPIYAASSVAFESAWKQARQLLCSDVKTKVSLTFEFKINSDTEGIHLRSFVWSGVSADEIDLERSDISEEEARRESQPYFHSEIPRFFGGQVYYNRMPSSAEINQRFAQAVAAIMPGQTQEIEAITKQFGVNDGEGDFDDDDPFA